MASHCVVTGCSNGAYKLNKWKKTHTDPLEKPPFQLFPIPTVKKEPEKRSIWLRNINRLAPGSKNKLFEPKKDARVCSEHFCDGKPTEENPHPTIKLGYDFEERSKRFIDDYTSSSSTRSKRRKRTTAITLVPSSHSTSSSILLSTQDIELSHETIEVSSPQSQTPQQVSTTSSPEPPPMSQSVTEISTFLPKTSSTSVKEESKNIEFDDDVEFAVHLSIPDSPQSLPNDKVYQNYDHDTEPGSSTSNCSKSTASNMEPVSQAIQPKQSQTTAVKNYLSRSFRGTLYSKLIKSDKKCNFYTNIASKALYEALFKVFWPYSKKRFNSCNLKSKGKKTGGRKKILSGIDEMLLTMMKLKLGLFFEDLGDRFGVSASTASRVFNCWIRAMALCLKSLIYMPDEEVIRATLPKKFSSCPDVVAIIDCSEIFIETPKDLELQAATWSDYKHHNTVKFLISTTPNSYITFISEPYTGRISDKAITNDSGFLDTVPSHTRIMADKGFNIQNECHARLINFLVPPGRRGTAQMTPSEVKTTTQVGKLRILVEQVIRRVKTFQIIAGEMPISLLTHLNDILIVCCGLSNLKGPIFDDRDI